ncbi:sensor histidine kinase [Lactococcus lactis]|uniref:sensor histidine kinase n=1 Tax=Lactococcus lactis TaxID=1358 RepID=UPI001D181EBC|nr:ATP-binding protein [Lactococcus lactis]MCC4121466.1 HAMP domain-containing protein [Lactococcus lactis]
MKYSNKVFLSLSFFFLIFYLIIGFWTLLIISQQALKQELARIQLEQQNSTLLLSTNMTSNSVTDKWMQNIVQQISIKDESKLFILDKKGNTVYSNNRELLHKNFIKRTFGKVPQDNIILISKINNEDNKKYIYGLSKIGSINYYLVTKELLYNYENIIRKASFYFRVILTSLIILFIPISWYLTRLLIRPVEMLTEVAEAISRGKIEQRFEIPETDDEVRNLTISLNQMADKLSNDIETITKEKEEQTFFASSISHEIRTPLTSILGYARLLQLEDLRDSTKEAVDYIIKEGLRLKKISEDIIKLIQLDKQQLQFKNLDSNTLETEINKFLSGIPKNFQFQVELDGATLIVDHSLLKLLYINIISNALEALSENGEILVKGKISQNRYYISFIDNGKGISEKNLEKIKTAFFTASASRSSNHLGLGLTFVQTIVSLHDGNLIITSKENIGTEVTVDFSLGGTNE